jgi:hypothetical protein
MWNMHDFKEILESKPKGKTFWTRTHSYVRYLRTLHLPNAKNPQITVAVMTGISTWKGVRVDGAQLFVRNRQKTKMSTFKKPTLTKLLDSPALELLKGEAWKTIAKATSFIASPDKTSLPTF